MDPLAPLRAVCLITGGLLHIAPWPTMREIITAGSVLNYHIAPYASTLLNHTINGYYAVIRGDGALMFHRAIGVLMNSYYVYTYLRYCPPSKQPDAQRFLTRVFGIFAAMMTWLHVMLPMLGLKEEYFFTHLALFAAFTGVGLAASPLATVGDVIRNRDSSSLPFGLCIMVTVQCTAWSIYAWMRKDWSTFANNIVGVVLGSIQLALIFSCPNRRQQSAQAAKSGSDASVPVLHLHKPGDVDAEDGTNMPLHAEASAVRADQQVHHR